MQMHEYECTKCLHKFVIVHPHGDHGKHNIVRCPKCSSTHIRLCFKPLVTPEEQPLREPASVPDEP